MSCQHRERSMIRILLIFVLLALTTSLPAAAETADGGDRIALVIGNSAYAHAPARPNALKDAETVASALRAVGFTSVTVANDMTGERMRAALADFANQASHADWAVLFFSGNGMQIGEVDFVLPIDTRVESAALTRETAV